MSIDKQILQDTLCSLMCANVRVHPKSDTLLMIETPFFFSDGDPYQIYVREMPGGVIRLTDMGHTLMHLSYENDTNKFRDGTRGKMFEQIKAECTVEETDGEFYIDAPLENLGTNIFRLGQALTKINDLTFLNRARAESTFYEDLAESLYKIISDEKITRDYHFPEMDNAEDYPIDYYIQGKTAPLYIFGIANRDKARLATIILERLLRVNPDFDSILIFSDLDTIPRRDLARLSNAGGEMIASLDAEEDFSRKLLRKVV